MTLPASCEKAILSRFLRAEAMAMWAVKSAQADVPRHALAFLKRHEEEEREHLKIFEGLTGEQAREKSVLPKLPKQWHAMSVHLYGYEALGLEFARLLAGLRPDLAHVLKDEEEHVGFFEREVKRILDAGLGPANGAREYARAYSRAPFAGPRPPSRMRFTSASKNPTCCSSSLRTWARSGRSAARSRANSRPSAS